MVYKHLCVIAGENTILIVSKEKRIQFTRENKDFDEIKEIVRSGDEEALLKRITRDTSEIPEYSEGKFKVDYKNEKIIDLETNTEVSLILGKRILEWAKDGLPFDPLLRFHRKVLQNPSKDSAKELYEFIEANKIPITEEGNFLAYKKVNNRNGKLVDCHSGTFDNSVGKIVSLKDRTQVDPNRRNECSYGLHVAGFSYMGSFSGDTIIEVEVEPQDVVAVPMDYKKAKMRVWRYKILRLCDGIERTERIVKVNKTAVKETTFTKNKNGILVSKEKVVKDKIVATVEGMDFGAMTANEVKKYILDNYDINMTDDPKNKKGIVKKAYKIVSENQKK